MSPTTPDSPRFLVRAEHLSIVIDRHTRRRVASAVLCNFGYAVAWRDHKGLLRQRVHVDRERAESHLWAIAGAR